MVTHKHSERRNNKTTETTRIYIVADCDDFTDESPRPHHHSSCFIPVSLHTRRCSSIHSTYTRYYVRRRALHGFSETFFTKDLYIARYGGRGHFLCLRAEGIYWEVMYMITYSYLIRSYLVRGWTLLTLLGPQSHFGDKLLEI